MRAKAVTTARRYLWVPRAWQVDVHYLLEGLEGLSLVRTLESRLGLMEVMLSPGQEAAIDEALEKLLALYPEIKKCAPPKGLVAGQP